VLQEYAKVLTLMLMAAIMFVLSQMVGQLSSIDSRLRELERTPPPAVGQITRVHPQGALSSEHENQIIDKVNELDRRCPR
jgi:hypothetical protein